MGKPTSTRKPKVGARKRPSTSKIVTVGTVSFPAPLPPASDLDLRGTGTVSGHQAAGFLEEVSAHTCTGGHEGAPRLPRWRGRLPGGGRLLRAVRVPRVPRVPLPDAIRPPHNGAGEVGHARVGSAGKGGNLPEAPAAPGPCAAGVPAGVALFQNGRDLAGRSFAPSYPSLAVPGFAPLAAPARRGGYGARLTGSWPSGSVTGEGLVGLGFVSPSWEGPSESATCSHRTFLLCAGSPPDFPGSADVAGPPVLGLRGGTEAAPVRAPGVWGKHAVPGQFPEPKLIH